MGFAHAHLRAGVGQYHAVARPDNPAPMTSTDGIDRSLHRMTSASNHPCID
jgi:hypothetical protein